MVPHIDILPPPSLCARVPPRAKATKGGRKTARTKRMFFPSAELDLISSHEAVGAIPGRLTTLARLSSFSSFFRSRRPPPPSRGPPPPLRSGAGLTIRHESNPRAGEKAAPDNFRTSYQAGCRIYSWRLRQKQLSRLSLFGKGKNKKRAHKPTAKPDPSLPALPGGSPFTPPQPKPPRSIALGIPSFITTLPPQANEQGGNETTAQRKEGELRPSRPGDFLPS